MTRPDKQLEAARREYQNAHYPHDLADQLGLSASPRRWPWAVGLAAAAFLIAALIILPDSSPAPDQAPTIADDQPADAITPPDAPGLVVAPDTPQSPRALVFLHVPRVKTSPSTALRTRHPKPHLRLLSTSKLPSLTLPNRRSPQSPNSQESQSWNASYANLG
ncbi:MAG: hypothetical protein CMJ49_08715 [Planctomycetaceae bacterium]|nr:hypothetical protein [Planctomycetaceae bacterium]